MTDVIMFVTPNFPNCKRAKRIIEEKHLQEVVQIYDASTVEGMAEMAFHNVSVSTAPTLLIDDKFFTGDGVATALLELAIRND